MFAINYSFETSGSQKHLSLEGGLASLLAAITIIVISFIFGKDIYLRKNIKIYSGKEIADEDSIIELSKFPLAFTYLDSNFEQQDNIFYFEIDLGTLDS